MKNKTLLRIKRKGFTLTEFMLTLGIMGMILVAIFMGYNVQMDNARSKEVIQEVKQIFQSAKDIYVSQENYSGVTMTVLNNSNALPSELQNASPYYNPWQGNYIITSVNSISGSSDILALTTNGIPQSACSRIVGALAPSLYMVYVNGTAASLTPAKSAEGWNRYNVNYGQITSLCKNKNNTIVFQMLKPFDATKYINPTLNTLTTAETTYINSERTRITNAMNKRESIQSGL